MGIRLTGETRSAVAMHEPEQETMTPPKAVLDEHSPGYYGWRVLAVSVVGMALSVGPLFWGSLGLLVGSLQTQFGWSRAQIMLALTWLTLTSVPAMPIVGRLIDRFGARRVLLPSIAVLAVTLAAVPFCVASRWHFYACFALAGFLTVGTQSVSYIRILSSWFDRRRGLAIGIAASGLGLGYLVVPMIVQAVLSVEDWPAVYWAMAALVGFVSLPLMYAVVRNDPPSDEARSGTVGAAARASGGMLLAEALRTREFWLIAAGIFIAATVFNSMLPTMAPMLTDRGMTAESAAFAVSIMGLAMFISRISVGYLIDVVFAPVVAAAVFALSTVGLILLAAESSGAVAVLAAFLIGLGFGAETDLMGVLVSRYFGLKAFGQIYGIMLAIFVIATGSGPYLAGLAYEAQGSYVGLLISFSALGAASAALFLFCRSYTLVSAAPARTGGA